MSEITRNNYKMVDKKISFGYGAAQGFEKGSPKDTSIICGIISCTLFLLVFWTNIIKKLRQNYFLGMALFEREGHKL